MPKSYPVGLLFVGALLGALLVAFLGAPARLEAQAPSPSEEPTPVESLQEELKSTKARLAQWRTKAAEYADAWAEAPERATRLEEQIADLEAGKKVEVPEDATVDQLDEALEAAERDLSEERAELIELEEEIASRTERRRKLPALLEDAKRRLAVAEQDSPASDDPALTAVRSELVPLRVEAIGAEIRAYETELESYDARGRLLSLQRDLTVLEIAHYERLTKALREALKKSQQRAVEREADEAREILDSLETTPSGVQAMVSELIEENRNLADRWTGEGGVTARIDDVSEKLVRAESQISSVDASLRDLRQQIAAVGLVDSVGLMLRRQRDESPDIGMYQRFIRMRQPEIGQVQLAQIQLRQKREQLSNIERRVEEVIDSDAAGVPPEDRERVEQALRELLQTQRNYLDELIDDYETYFEKLVDFDARQRELIDRTKKLNEFIDARVLWVPSGQPMGIDAAALSVDALEWLLGSRYRAQLWRATVDAAQRDLWLTILFVLAAVLSVLLAPRARRRIGALGEQVRSHTTTSFMPTIEALGLTLLMVPWLPGLVIYLGWHLGRSPQATHYVRSVSEGIVAAGVFWLTLRFVNKVLRPNGLAVAHAKFPSACAATLRRHLVWFGAISVPAIFVMFVLEAHGKAAWTESLGRLAFLVGMGAAAAYTYFVVKPGGPVATLYKLDGLSSQRARWWAAGRVFVLIVPIGFGVAALTGYYWTALQLAFRYHLTLLFLFSLQVVFNLSIQWALVARRRVARDQMDQPAEDDEEEAVDLVTVEAQTRRLIRGTILLVSAVGVLLIWAEVLPAVGILRHVELWSTTKTVTLSLQDAAGVARETTETRLVPVTLADLVGALVIGMVALALVRNLPGLLNVSVFRRLNAGERYAYSTLVKYAIALGGIGWALSTIGLGWSNIQWLVAALGVGLGFGLQEIFANFVSGLIILFERPIRVGDTVTVGQVSGVVTKIRTRATWITGFDRRELVVPNKEFVTQQLINWSLSDSVLRIEIEVGIAYGSNTEKATEVLRRIAKEHPHVLDEPPPQVLFLGFGDSSLLFELRAFLPDVTYFLRTKHELHMAVDAAFREAGIEIAFPQRDLHVRTIPVEWKREPGSTES